MNDVKSILVSCILYKLSLSLIFSILKYAFAKNNISIPINCKNDDLSVEIYLSFKQIKMIYLTTFYSILHVITAHFALSTIVQLQTYQKYCK